MRPVDQILRDWREAEASLPKDGSTPDLGLIQRITFLRAEYEAAIDEREDEAEELRRPPGQGLTVGNGSVGA
jgi:hypothetical protein